MRLANADIADQSNTVATNCEMYGQYLERESKKASLRILLDTCTSHAPSRKISPQGRGTGTTFIPS